MTSSSQIYFCPPAPSSSFQVLIFQLQSYFSAIQNLAGLLLFHARKNVTAPTTNCAFRKVEDVLSLVFVVQFQTNVLFPLADQFFPKSLVVIFFLFRVFWSQQFAAGLPNQTYFRSRSFNSVLLTAECRCRPKPTLSMNLQSASNSVQFRPVRVFFEDCYFIEFCLVAYCSFSFTFLQVRRC